MNFTSSELLLLEILSNGACHRESVLGTLIDCTESEISEQILHLIEAGIPINQINSNSYQLNNPIILLSKTKIQAHLDSATRAAPFNFHIFPSIDSTNRYLKDIPLSDKVDICCAEFQTQGRGRFGRYWHSPFGENIYCSSRWNLNYDLSKLSGLSLISSLAVLATLNELALASDIKIKWPNDILWKDKKLCGSLIEIMPESHGIVSVIIGIGLNVNTDTQNQPLADKLWCSLYEITQKHLDRNLLIAKLLSNLESYINSFIRNDLNYFIDEWNQVDYLRGKQIKVTQALNTIEGIARGISPLGQLILENESGIMHFLSSGDTSLGSALNLLM